MTCLDTDFLVALLRGDEDATARAGRIKTPRTTIVNAFELYYGAKRSARPKESLKEVRSLLGSMEVLGFEDSAALKAAQIQAELMASGRPVNILDVLIGAIVMVAKERLLTRNVDHFKRIPGLKWSRW